MSLKKNFFYNTIYQILILLLPMVTVPYISRVLGPQGIGEYSYTNSYAQYFVLLGMIGISLYGNRQIAYTKKNKEKMSLEFWNIYTLQLLTTILSLVVYIIIFVIINKDNRLLYGVQAITIVSATFDISWFFIGYEDMKSVVLRNTIAKIIGVLLIFILVKDSSDVVIYAAIMAITMLLGQVIMWKELKGKVIYKKPCFKYMVKHLRPSLALFISQLAMQVYVLLDRTMLGFMTNDSQVGLYDNSQKTIKLVLALVTSVGTVMLPRMSSLYSEGKMDEFKDMVYKAFSFINFVAFPMTFGLLAISKDFSSWFYGPSFNGIQILLIIGSFLILAISWSNILGIQVMLPMRMERQFTISVCVGAVVNVILNILLIPTLFSLGTTFASVIAEFAVTLVQVLFLRKFVDLNKIIRTVWKPLAGSIIMMTVVFIVEKYIHINGILATIVQTGIGIIIYILVMAILKSSVLNFALKEIKSKIGGK
ncbi:MAG: flippase [Clostridium chrysemydis]|uniref:flippase n=1 Tax=Clostridium TaxID=1485 RepID=UPI0021521BA8|nr:flippase [Clostridium sp. LY3-2]MCR6513732.1 flippase [Clostridium sp. LY3-2]